jgi:RimJ/RimL family protein N-acetyltransferase
VGILRIQTERLILRPFVMNDFKSVHEYASDPDVCKYMVYGPNTIQETIQFLHMAISEIEKEPCVNLHLAIVHIQSSQLIGACDLGGISMVNLDADLEYCLNKRCWKRGYATEAARAVIAHGFANMGLHRIHATCRPANETSAKVLQKAGMKVEGHLREHRLVRANGRILYCSRFLHMNGSRKASSR